MRIINKLKSVLKKSKADSTPIVEEAFVPRAPRIHLNSLHSLEFRAIEPSFSSDITVVNISTNGIGLSLSAEFPNFSGVERIIGELNVGGVAYPITLETVRRSERFIGAIFENPSHNFSGFFQFSFFFHTQLMNCARIRLKRQ